MSESLYTFHKKTTDKNIVTPLKTWTYKIDPILYDTSNRPIPASGFSWSINKNGFISINVRRLTNGTYTIFRNTKLDLTWTDSENTSKKLTLSAFQYVKDVYSASLNTALSDLVKFNEKFYFNLVDHLYSMHGTDLEKPKANPNGGDIQDIPSDTGLLLFKYILRYPLPPNEFSPTAGFNKVSINNSYTPVASLTINDNTLTLRLYKNLFDPRKENRSLKVYGLPNNVKQAVIYCGYNRFVAQVEENLGLIILKTSINTDLTLFNLAVKIDNVFVPLEVFYKPIRDFPS